MWRANKEKARIKKRNSKKETIQGTEENVYYECFQRDNNASMKHTKMLQKRNTEHKRALTNKKKI